MSDALPLTDLLRQAGAVMTQRTAHPVPAHYGSPAGELAVCVSRVGFAVRSDLAVLTISGPPRGVDLLSERVLHHGVAPRGVVFDGDVYWCRSGARSELVVICPSTQVRRVITRLHQDVNRLPHLSLVDVSESVCIFNVIGKHTRDVLADLAVYGPTGDPRDAAPFTDAPILDRPVSWLLVASVSALAIVASSDAIDVWNALAAAGRPYAMGRVGLEALIRYRLIDSSTRRRSGMA